MTKFDHRVNLPALFQKHGLSILPTSRGSYVLSSFEAYHPFEKPAVNCTQVHLPQNLQSLSPQFITSEAIALNYAYSCGILADFIDDGRLYPTANGRMGSGDFSFAINTRKEVQTISVEHAQIEIDAGYEGETSLSLIEAKMDLADDFLIRQLYYPFRAWSQRIDKTVRTIFLVYTNGIFYLYEYRFEDPHCYNSLVLVRQKNYAIDTGLGRDDLNALLNAATLVGEPDPSFPQADSLPRVINLMERLQKAPLAPGDITHEYGFTPRQTSYYTTAGRYLGLIERTGSGVQTRYALTKEGEQILKLPYSERQLALCRQILRHPVFFKTAKQRLVTGQLPAKKEVAALMQQCGLLHVDSIETRLRRASTVLSWVNWIFERFAAS